MEINNGLIIQYWYGGSIPPITFNHAVITVFDDGIGCHCGSYFQIPGGYGNSGAIGIGY